MTRAAQRLLAIQSALTNISVSDDQKVDNFILPDGAVMTAKADSVSPTNFIHIDGLIVCEYQHAVQNYSITCTKLSGH